MQRVYNNLGEGINIQIKENASQPYFAPIELTITIESEEELCDLWHRLNASVFNIDNKNEYVHYLKYSASRATEKFWSKINSLVKERNLVNK